ncbi:MAG: DUF4259 domain-containing protein, partial [Planctomycetota bacterium]
MGTWGYKCWENDAAADWFLELFEGLELAERISATFDRDNPDEIRAACHVLTQLGRIYVWPGEGKKL